MAGTQAQNVQRGIIMLWFFNVILMFVFVTIRCIKKQIDPTEEEPDKYVDNSNAEKQRQSNQQLGTFDQVAVQRSVIKEDATKLEKAIHAFNEIKLFYAPLSILLPFNILTGTSFAFCLTLFCIIFTVLILFNSCKLHKKLTDHKCVAVVFENLWLILTFFYCVNVWGAKAISQPYIVI